MQVLCAPRIHRISRNQIFRFIASDNDYVDFTQFFKWVAQGDFYYQYSSLHLYALQQMIFMVVNGQTCEHEVKQPINIHSTFCWRILTYLCRCFTGIWYLVLFDKSDARVGWLGDIYFVLTHGEHWAITTLDLPQTWSAPWFHRGVVTHAICLISSH